MCITRKDETKFCILLKKTQNLKVKILKIQLNLILVLHLKKKAQI